MVNSRAVCQVWSCLYSLSHIIQMWVKKKSHFIWVQQSIHTLSVSLTSSLLTRPASLSAERTVVGHTAASSDYISLNTTETELESKKKCLWSINSYVCTLASSMRLLVTTGETRYVLTVAQTHTMKLSSGGGGGWVGGREGLSLSLSFSIISRTSTHALTSSHVCATWSITHMQLLCCVCCHSLDRPSNLEKCIVVNSF